MLLAPADTATVAVGDVVFGGIVLVVAVWGVCWLQCGMWLVWRFYRAGCGRRVLVGVEVGCGLGCDRRVVRPVLLSDADSGSARWCVCLCACVRAPSLISFAVVPCMLTCCACNSGVPFHLTCSKHGWMLYIDASQVQVRTHYKPALTGTL